MFDARDARRLAGLPLEKQVVEILLEEDALMPREEIQKQLVPRPSRDAFAGLIARLCIRNHVAEFSEQRDENRAPLIGLPGWAITKERFKPAAAATAPVSAPHQVEHVEAPAATPTPSKENTMPKKSAGPRVSKAQADDAVEKVLTETGATVADIAKDASIPQSSAMFALARMKSSGRAARTRHGKGYVWHKAGVAGVPASTASKPHAAKANGNGRRFGYFDDGSVVIDCSDCKGTMTAAELKAFRDFAKEHAK